MKFRILFSAVFLSLAAVVSAQDSPLGGWRTDGQGLPAFEFTAALPVKTVTPEGKPWTYRTDPFFLLGNYRVTVFPHVSGIYQLLTGERSWARVNTSDANVDNGDNRATLTVVRAGATNHFELAGMESLAANPQQCRRTFGTGFARYDFTPMDGLACRRSLSVPPSLKVNEGVPAFVISVLVTNSGSALAKITYTESTTANFTAVIDRFKTDAERLVTYTNLTAVDQKHALARADIFAVAKDPTLFRSRDYGCKYDGFPPSLLLHIASAGERGLVSKLETTRIASGHDRLAATVEFELQPGESRAVNFVVGLAPDTKADAVLALGRSLKPSADGEYFRAEWKHKLPDLSAETNSVFRREMVWDAYTLEAMATYSEFYHETFIPQGTTYDYNWDEVCAPRDHLQHALAVCYTDPALAKSSIRYVLKKMTEQGKLEYSDYGFGKTTGGGWTPSDLQLYLFMTVAEYLRITGDAGFLLEKTEFLPMEARHAGTTLDKLDRALMYLRDEVGDGSHGLVRLMNSDWSDNVYYDVSPLRYYWGAESHMNSAMVVAVFPELIRQLERAAADKKLSAERAHLEKLLAGLKRYHGRIRDAFYKDLGDRTFSRRLYLDEKTPRGENVMDVEPQPFLLLAEDFPVNRKRTLLQEIHHRILDGEVLGARQGESPSTNSLMKVGTSENGGFWYALNGPLIAGVGTFDKPAAWELLQKMTFDNFTRHFPDYWVGQWTAPDTMNSTPSGPMAGLGRPGRLWGSFAVYCAHAHAWPLYCYYRLKETEKK